MFFLYFVALFLRAPSVLAQYCKIPPPSDATLTVQCANGFAYAQKGVGLVLTCPNGIAKNSVGMSFKPASGFPTGNQPATARASYSGPNGSVRGGSGGVPYVRFTAASSDGLATFAATLYSAGQEREIEVLSKVCATANCATPTIVELDDKALLSDSNFTVKLAKSTTTAMSDAALSLNVSSGAKVSKTVPVWSTAGYSLMAELGNDGPSDIEVSVAMVIVNMQSGDGVLNFDGSYLCVLYGDAAAPSTMPPITAPPPSGESCADYYVCQQCVETTLVKSRCQWCYTGDKGECRAPDSACVAPLLTPVMPFGACPAMTSTTVVGGCKPCVKMTRAMCPEGMIYSTGPPDVCGCDTVGECKALTRVIFTNAATPLHSTMSTLVVASMALWLV